VKTGNEAGTHEGPKLRVLSEGHRLKKYCKTKYDTEIYKSSTTRTENAPKKIDFKNDHTKNPIIQTFNLSNFEQHLPCSPIINYNI
jgi:hypothetical protein